MAAREAHPNMGKLFEPRHEKTGFLHMQNKDADQLRGISAFVFATDSTISLLRKSEISSL